MNRKPAIGIGIAAIVAVLCLAALASNISRSATYAAVDAEQYADFIENEVFDIQDLAEGAEIQRRMFNRITPPGVSWTQPMFPPVVPFDAENFDERFLGALLGEDKYSVAIYPLSLALDPNTRDTLVFNAGGNLIATIPADRVSREWPEDADPARVILQLDLLPFEDVEPYLYAERRIEETLASYTVMQSECQASQMRSSNAFRLSEIRRQTNGHVRLTVTNGNDLAEIYATTVWHTSSVSVVTWTNDQDEVITSTNVLWHPVSPSFNGIESEWVSLTNSLVLSNGVGVFVDADIPDDARVRFYAAAQRVDSDGDGISDGEEIFLYRTDPNDPADFSIIPELEAALAEVNALQIWYLVFLGEGASARSSGPANYAQVIQQMRSALEGVLGSYLDLDVNPGGVLAEGPQVITWTLPTVLASVGNSTGTWRGGMASPAQFQEIEAVRQKLTHLVHEATSSSGYAFAPVSTNAGDWMVDDWDLGTGYPPNWPQSQPISTYVLFHDMIEFPNAGWGTVDDYFCLNSTSFLEEYIYRKHVADITAPIWNPGGSNVLQLWDCGNCAGTNNHAYLSPFTVLHVLEVPTFSVSIEEVGFTGDHLIREWPSGQAIDYPDGSSPTWKKTDNPNKPVAYTKGANPTAFAKASVSPLDYGSPLTVDFRINIDGNVIAEKIGVQLDGVTVALDSIIFDSALETTVKKAAPVFEWEIKLSGLGAWASIGTSGPHAFYWTHATPLEDPLYDLALERACTYADGQTNEFNVASALRIGIYEELGNRYFRAGTWKTGSAVLETFNSTNDYFICATFANLTAYLNRTLGLSAIVVHVWAGTSTHNYIWEYTGSGSQAPNSIGSILVNPGLWFWWWHAGAVTAEGFSDAALGVRGIDIVHKHPDATVKYKSVGYSMTPQHLNEVDAIFLDYQWP